MTRRSTSGLPRSAAANAAFWPWVLAIATVAALLLAIHQVVQAAVLEGELLRKNHAAYAEAAWHSNSSRSAILRANCLAKLTVLLEPQADPQSQ